VSFTHVVVSVIKILTWIVVLLVARAQKVAEWKDRKEAILRGEVTAADEAADTGVDSIYNVQEEASDIQY